MTIFPHPVRKSTVSMTVLPAGGKMCWILLIRSTKSLKAKRKAVKDIRTKVKQTSQMVKFKGNPKIYRIYNNRNKDNF